MFQTLVLFEHLPSPEWLDVRYKRGDFRATAVLTSGPYEGLALISKEGPHHDILRRIRLDTPSHVPTRAQAVAVFPPPIPWPTPLPSHLPGDDEIVFCLLKIARAEVDGYFERIAARAQDINFAAARILGHTGHNALLEVVGADASAVFQSVVELTESDVVEPVEVLRTTGELTNGFGEG